MFEFRFEFEFEFELRLEFEFELQFEFTFALDFEKLNVSLRECHFGWPSGAGNCTPVGILAPQGASKERSGTRPDWGTEITPQNCSDPVR